MDDETQQPVEEQVTSKAPATKQKKKRCRCRESYSRENENCPRGAEKGSY